MQNLIDILGSDYAEFDLTEHTLKKGEIERAVQLNELLKKARLSSFDDLENGENSELKACIFSGVSLVDTIVTIRKTGSRGDRRFCVYNLHKYAQPDDKLIIWIKDEVLIIVTIDPVQGVNECLTGKLRNLMIDRTAANGGGQSGGIALEDNSKMAVEDRVARLIERSFGGVDVAASPSDKVDPFWPLGPYPVGVSETIGRLRERISSSENQEIVEWVFLVGGAGNGKSEAAKDLNKVLEAKRQSPDKVQAGKKVFRCYRYSRIDSGDFIIINDATVSSRKDYPRDKGALMKDIDDALENDRMPCFLANINRGILLEESVRKSMHKPISGQIIDWLIGESIKVTKDDTFLEIVELPDSIESGKDYYKTAKLIRNGNCKAYLHVVSMDYGSLFEPRSNDEPAIEWDNEQKPSLSKTNTYRTLQFNKSDQSERSSCPAATIIDEFIVGFGSIKAPEEPCPIISNLMTLANQDLIPRILKVARAAEMSSGAKLSYRELWEYISLLIIGPSVPCFRENSSVGPLTWSKKMYGEWKRTKKLSLLIELSLHRMHMAIFRAGHPVLPGNISKFKPQNPILHSPVTKILSCVDPVKDASREWVSTVYDAMEQLQLGEVPSSYLIKKEPAFKAVWTDFDILLEEEIEKEISKKDTKDNESRALRSWLGQYITRLYAMAKGIPAFENVFSVISQSQVDAELGKYELKGPLASGLRQMIIPKWGKDGDWENKLILPLLNARNEPVVKQSRAPLLCYAYDHDLIRFKTGIENGRLMLNLTTLGESKNIAKMPLDFLIAREALAHCSNENGFTELGPLAAPRIERIRSRLLSNSAIDSLRDYSVVLVQDDQIIELSQ